ncbi:glycosyltransferase family 2 protein [Arthrobacter jiangjiafuii]|uniref:Glycosyltransferase family 2 protein n=1 Tax=Arthrobacter jiangjiafuii TaxID=2817475 RepID=A0A975M3L8_9MICC|nr:glycosyltransferase family 2 protein [Arthrobacter jiangjiafuii]MBP3044626.1 glycosyltransferase family 2 protein [Arthrobacter jiangjiafuii]QWC09277.1 glycosyltransferase family 2 protein [Arthrobacter jiangjiafuii]
MNAVDILLPYYGEEELMRQSVLSIKAQHRTDWRLIVLDDAYPHAQPQAWFNSLCDPRIYYERNTENLGANRNFQKALNLAQAPVVVMMGADDIMLPTYLDEVLGLLASHPEATVIQPGVRVIDGEGLPVSSLADTVKSLVRPSSDRPVTLAGEQMAASLLHAGWHYFPSLAWRLEKIRKFGFRPEYDVVQDLALLMDIAASGGSMVVASKNVVFSYRRHAASDSSVRAVDGRRFDEERRFFREQADRFAGMGWHRASRAARLHWTSRLHAVSLLLRSLPRPTIARTRVLGRHALT